MTNATKKPFYELPLAEQVEFEGKALGVARELLPSCALAVLDGALPTPAYLAWIEAEWQDDPSGFIWHR